MAKKQKDPAVLFYTSDFLTGTAFFTDEQRGQYIRLLCEQHQLGHIPEDHLLEVCKCHGNSHGIDSAYPPASPVLKKFVKDAAGNYFNERMEQAIIDRVNYTEKQRVKANKRWSKSSKEDALAYATVSATAMPGDMPGGNGNENENINRNRSENAKKKRATKIVKNDFLNDVINTFSEVHGDYIVVNPGKERMMAAKIVSIYKKINPDADSEAMLYDLREYFGRCMKIKDVWIQNNMSLSLVVSKFNEINKMIKNEGNQATQRGGATNEELATLLAEKFGIR